MNKQQLEVQKLNADEEAKVIRQLKQVYTQASKDCESKIRELSSRSDLENIQSIVYQKQYQEAIKKQLDSVLNDLNTKSFSTIAEYLGTSYEDGFFGTLYDLQGQGIPLCFPIDQEQVVKALQTDSKLSKGLYNKLGEDTDYLKKSIKAELSRGISNGESWNQIAGHIANGMNSPFNKAYNNSIRIARTEGHRIQSEATLHCQQKAKAKGADVVKQWDSTLDGITRPTHKELDGQIREVEEPFEVAGMVAMYPGGFGKASEDCNCRCCLLQRARWALSDEEYTKMNGCTNELVKIEEKDYNRFKEKVKETIQKNISKENKKDYSTPIKLNSNDEVTFNEWKKNYTKSNDKIKLSKKEAEALNLYGDEYFDAMNGIERFEKGTKEYQQICDNFALNNLDAFKKKNDSLDVTISKFKNDNAMILHRYVNNVDFITGSGSSISDMEAAIGKRFTEKGFTSTSVLPDITSHFGSGKMKTHIEILAPKGVNGGFVQDYVSHTEEYEFILNRNTNFEIVGVETKSITVEKRDLDGKMKKKKETERILRVKVVE